MAVKDLLKVSGLPIRVDDRTGKLSFGGGLPPVAPVECPLAELREELLQPGAPGPDPAYAVYSGVGFPADREKLAAMGLTYGLTVIPPGMAGRELNKTGGQYRAVAPGGLPYPEVWAALLGTAFLLCQKPAPGAPGAGSAGAPGAGSAGAPGADVDDAVLLELEPGQTAVIPPAYGVVAINPGPGALVLARLAASAAAPVTAPYRQRRGACYYCTLDEQNEPEFVENPRYGRVPDLRMVPAEDRPDLGLPEGVPLYTAAVRAPEQLGWLLDPVTVAGRLAFPELDDDDEDDDEE